ncbi:MULTISPECIES: hypothetical protein [Lentilactobacillus]|uniref:hypothetical protein n=1 Tax=Lentilactobacillus TaxID=2767893 RepID=UPI0021C29B8E|nr:MULTISPECIES: hypothetical protein [Lentilactobacillus]MCP9332154.1 hypothetical protein [Lentilactobacillus hilgardii]MCP9348784.1 hypothetical protein [Lentilactobacillus hilgardii]MCP9351637.1 hypothetical protein [Lentilactobacillus hilgardii]MDM7515220.1 hypothetical protein [Lentilactobacillus sp. TOM.63]
MFSWITHNLTVFFGSVVTLAGVIAGLIHSSKADANSATKERTDLEKFILKTVKDDNEDLRKRYEDLSSKFNEMDDDYDRFKDYHDKIVKQLQEQIDLKEEENKNLRQKNAALKKENAAYRARYGKLEE